jgi:hypothetical protein
MEKLFDWRELTEDGLLKNVPEHGPYYDRKSVGGPFKTEEEAMEAMRLFQQDKFLYCNDYVLVPVYRRKS